MDIEKLLELGIQKEIITAFQKNQLLNLLNNSEKGIKETSTIIKILYYIGGFIMLCAMISLMSHTVQHSSYLVILGLGMIYTLLFLGVGEYLWRKNEKFPAGILYFLFVSAIAFIIIDVEKMIGFFPHFSDINKYENYYELCRLPILVLSSLTILVNTILQKYRNESLLAIPTIFCSYAIFITILHYFIGDNISETVHITNANLIFSLALLIIAFIKDRFTKADYSKWMYFFASIGIFQSMIYIFNNYFASEINENIIQTEIFVLSFVYCILGSLIQRKSFAIIGLLGIIEYIMYLEFHFISENTTLLTSIVLITGLLILYAGVLLSQNSSKINLFLENLLPQEVKNYLPQNRKVK